MDRSEAGSRLATQLAALAGARGWDRFGVFRVEYERAARGLDRQLIATSPSRAQLHRWFSGDLRRLPYVDHCRVLEAMFPGWSVQELLGPPVEEARAAAPHAAGLGPLPTAAAPAGPAAAAAASDLTPSSYEDVTAIYASRSAFMANVSPLDLFDQADEIRAAGLSLNLLCQHVSDQHLGQLVDRGARIQALFLEPDGDAIRRREMEEGIAPGHLSTLTSLNIALLLRIRDRAPSARRDNVTVAVYDEPIRFNLTFVDTDLCIAQPYLPAMRGVDSPTMVIRRRRSGAGLYAVFSSVFGWIEDRSRAL